MGSKIEWTDETWNPATGCSVVSPGCEHCYAWELSSNVRRISRNLRDQSERDVDGRPRRNLESPA